jgi:hypothetical protein
MRNLQTYDKAKWHFNHSTFPQDVGKNKGHLYGGFFLIWAINNGLVEWEDFDDLEEEIELLTIKKITPGQFYAAIGGVLASDMFNEVGNAFSWFCFESEEFDYYALFEELLAKNVPSPYHVLDSWDNFKILNKALDTVFNNWKENH